MSSQTTLCAKTVCANAGRMNDLKLETSSAGVSPLLTLKNTNDDGNGAVLVFRKDPETATATADTDTVGSITFVAKDDAANDTEYASIVAAVVEADGGNEAGSLTLNVAIAGTSTAGLTLEGPNTSGSTVNATIGSGATSVVSIPGSLIPTSIGQLISIPHSQAGTAAPFSIMGVVDAADATAYNFDACDKLFHYLSTKDSLTASEAATLFDNIAATASSSATIDNAAAGDISGGDGAGFATDLKPQFLTGGFGGAAKDIGNVNPFVDSADNGQQILVFGSDVVSTGAGALTLTLAGSDRVDSSGSSIAFTGVDNNVFTITAAAGGDATTDIVITPQSGSIIKQGSFLYKENVGANLVIIRGYLKISGVALTSATC